MRSLAHSMTRWSIRNSIYFTSMSRLKDTPSRYLAAIAGRRASASEVSRRFGAVQRDDRRFLDVRVVDTRPLVEDRELLDFDDTRGIHPGKIAGEAHQQEPIFVDARIPRGPPRCVDRPRPPGEMCPPAPWFQTPRIESMTLCSSSLFSMASAFSPWPVASRASRQGIGVDVPNRKFLIHSGNLCVCAENSRAWNTERNRSLRSCSFSGLFSSAPLARDPRRVRPCSPPSGDIAPSPRAGRRSP